MTRGAALRKACLAGLALLALVARADVEAGRAKAQPCFACHGETGMSSQAAIPSLAGQPRQFLISALFQFREGKRVNEVMSPMAANLSNKDMNDLADFFASLPMKPPTASIAPERAAQARTITQRNNCTACHTASLTGQQHIPRLAGQQREYLAAQLKAFRASTRGELDGVMTSAAQGLSAEDIDVLSEYMATLSGQ